MKKVIFSAALVAAVSSQALAESPSITNMATQSLSQTQRGRPIDMAKAKEAIMSVQAEVDSKLNTLFTGKVNSVVIGGQVVVEATELATTTVAVPKLMRIVYSIGQDLNENKPSKIKAQLKELGAKEEALEKVIETQGPQAPGVMTQEMKELEQIAAQIGQKESELKASLKSLNVQLGRGLKIFSKTVNGTLYLYAAASLGSRVYIVSHLESDPGLFPVIVIGADLGEKAISASTDAAHSMMNSVPSTEAPINSAKQYVNAVVEYIKKMTGSSK